MTLDKSSLNYDCVLSFMDAIQGVYFQVATGGFEAGVGRRG